MSLSPSSVIHYEGFKCFVPGSGGSDPSSVHEGPQTPELAGSKHFTLTPDTRGLVNIGKRGDPEIEEEVADREQPFNIFLLGCGRNHVSM